MASLTVNFIKNSNCEEVRPAVVSCDEDTRKKGYLIKLTHTGRFCKNDVILINYIWELMSSKLMTINVITINFIKIIVIKVNVI